MRTVFVGFLTAGLLNSSAYAQTATWNGLSDRFQVDAGYFRLNANTTLRYDGPSDGSGDVSLEKDLGQPGTVNTYWVEGTWRVGRRHQLRLGFTHESRGGNGHTLERDFVWNGETYNAGLTSNSTSSGDILGGYYRFSVYRNDRFEIGPALGFGYLWLSAGIRATGTVTTPGGPVSRTLDASASTGSVTGALGAFANAWPARKLALRADFLYIKVKPENSEASVKDWRLAANYYFTKTIGVGVQYKYNRYTYDRGILVSKLGGEIQFDGVQIFGSFLF
jgi:predicted porin